MNQCTLPPRHPLEASTELDIAQSSRWDGFAGFKTAAAEEFRDATAVMDPLQVVRLAADALDACRRRVQQDLFGHRGDEERPALQGPPHPAHRRESAHREQKIRLNAVCAVDEHVAAYREHDKTTAKQMTPVVIIAITTGVPTALVEIRRLGRTMKQRTADILAFFERPGTSNGPTEAINARLEHLDGSALGFRNLTHDIARSLLEAGGFRPALHPRSR